MLTKRLASLLCFVGMSAAGLSGCGMTTTTLTNTNLTVEMYGVFQTPAGAQGDSVPKWQTYALEQVTLHLTAGDEDLITDTDPTSVKILDRPQIIFEKSLSKYDDEPMTGITVSFDPVVVVEGQEKSNHALTLDSGDLALDASKTIDAAKGLDLKIKVAWRNTVDTSGTETVTAPEFELTLD